jgi:hypothetical protein
MQKRTAAILTFSIIGLFALNVGLAVSNQTFGSFSWGLYKQDPLENVLFYVTDDVGKAPPAGSHTVSSDVFGNVEGDFWNGMPDPDHLTNLQDKGSGYETQAAFWKDFFVKKS